MIQRCSLYPIHAISRDFDDEPFDTSVLPFHVTESITEDVSGLLASESWAIAHSLSQDGVKALKAIKHALVERYEVASSTTGSSQDVQSLSDVRDMAALLRLLRPMPQLQLDMQGTLTSAGLDIDHLTHPLDHLHVPPAQKLFTLLNRDLVALRNLAPSFLKASAQRTSKWFVALAFHEAGHWDDGFWKARYALWMAGLDGLYTTVDWAHYGRKYQLTG